MISPLLILVTIALCVVVIVLLLRIRKLTQKYAGIIDIENEISRAQGDLKRENERFQKSEADHKTAMERLSQDYKTARSLYDQLRNEVSVLEETLEDISFGLYRPHYSFDDPESYKQALDQVYQTKQSLIKQNKALSCPNNWTVNGSAKEGAKMIKQESKLMLRAFNGEVDAAIAKVTWNNVTKMEERIRRTFDAVNALGSVMGIRISSEYLDLALSELHLTHELELKKQQIKDEQREIREQMREEEKAQREFERAKKAAELEELRYSKALESARAELAKAKASEMQAVERKIQALEASLAEAQSKLDRAVSMAQLTKSGHVYIISNIGSFGEDVFKIGMSRRLDPEERVYELGSASVPFPYDIHAMIYSLDAPGLENAFHKHFSDKRVNMVNPRKEFFRVSITELEQFARKHKADIQLTKLAEAKEYRETLTLMSKANEASESLSTEKNPATEVQFPESLPY